MRIYEKASKLCRSLLRVYRDGNTTSIKVVDPYIENSFRKIDLDYPTNVSTESDAILRVVNTQASNPEERILILGQALAAMTLDITDTGIDQIGIDPDFNNESTLNPILIALAAIVRGYELIREEDEYEDEAVEEDSLEEADDLLEDDSELAEEDLSLDEFLEPEDEATSPQDLETKTEDESEWDDNPIVSIKGSGPPQYNRDAKRAGIGSTYTDTSAHLAYTREGDGWVPEKGTANIDDIPSNGHSSLSPDRTVEE